MARSIILAECGRCFTQGRQFHADPACEQHADPLLIVERSSNELIAEWSGTELEIGQTIVVTEMDTPDNRVSCRVLSIHERTIEVEIIQGRLIVIDPDDEEDWPFSGQPPGYRDEPVESGPLVRLA